MFENTYLYRIYRGRRYSGTILCYFTIFNFIYKAVDTSEMYDDLLVVKNYENLSAKLFLGTSTVIEKVGLLLYF